MSNHNLAVMTQHPFVQGLACAAIHPDLRSILVFDATYTGLLATANLFAQMIENVTDREVKQTILGVSEQEDDLWGGLSLYMNEEKPILRLRGLLTETQADTYLRLIVIPNLTTLSLAAARAGVMLIRADVVHLERNGQHQRWKPTLCWLASCSRAQVGIVSPHLLDRFAIRLNWYDVHHSGRAQYILNQVLQDQPLDDMPAITLPDFIKEQLQKGARVRPSFGNKDQVIKRIFSYTSDTTVYTPRREIALARYAVAVAQYENSPEVTPLHVDKAAYLMGLALSPEQQNQKASSSQEVAQPDIIFDATKGGESQFDNNMRLSLPRIKDAASHLPEPVYATDRSGPMEILTLPIDPYPEDTAPTEREVASLRLPFSRYASNLSSRGISIGVEQTTIIQDLSLVSTLLAAAPFQPLRHEYLQDHSQRLLLSVTDLRRYRREPAAERMLLLLIDYTSLRECDWQEALLPYLRKAYIDRASIGIVRVGAKNASNELRAELVSARSILVPRIGEALDAIPGRATPLAHGFDLAWQTLCRVLQQGRTVVRTVTFIVISDGRGNIPLEVSRKGRFKTSVFREGIEDALGIAEHIRTLKDVHTLFFNPQPSHHSDLPFLFANVLGAEVLPIEHIERGEI
jgi:magnesium chelatase subunit D